MDADDSRRIGEWGGRKNGDQDRYSSASISKARTAILVSIPAAAATDRIRCRYDPTSSCESLAAPAAGDHLFDAKFKVRKFGEVVQTGDDVDEATQSDERRGVFKSADLYKMHTYRDAIVSARTVWILYPGSEFHFFDEEHGSIRDPGHLAGFATGVGAIPLRPGELRGEIATMVRRLIEGENGPSVCSTAPTPKLDG